MNEQVEDEDENNGNNNSTLPHPCMNILTTHSRAPCSITYQYYCSQFLHKIFPDYFAFAFRFFFFCPSIELNGDNNKKISTLSFPLNSYQLLLLCEMKKICKFHRRLSRMGNVV